MNKKSGCVLGLLAFALGSPSLLHAELVYEGSTVSSGAVPGVASPQREDREAIRKTLQVAEKAQVSQSVEISPPQMAAAVAAVPMAPVAAVAAPAASISVEVEHASKSELMRRERLRHELRNEDILQERLEELRLRDERKRTDELLGAKTGSLMSEGSPVVQQSAPVREEVVLPSVVDSPAPKVALLPASSVGATGVSAPVQVAASSGSVATVGASSAFSSEEKAVLSVAPRAGVSTMAASTGYNVQSRYSAGLGFGVGVSENLGLEAGYLFSEYGVAVTSSNPWVYNYQAYLGSSEPIAMKQNVLDVGLKLFFLGPESRVRPYIGGGGAYSKSFVNYDSRIIDVLGQMGFQNLARDYEVSSFLGFVSTGLDIRLSKSVSVGANFKYYSVLSARENGGLNPYAIGGYTPGAIGYTPGAVGFNPYTGNDSDKQILGGSLARSGFYSVTAGLSFVF